MPFSVSAKASELAEHVAKGSVAGGDADAQPWRTKERMKIYVAVAWVMLPVPETSKDEQVARPRTCARRGG